MSERDPFARPDSEFNTLPSWTWIGCYGGYYLQSDLLSDQGFEHGFFTRRWQGRGPDELAGYLSAGVRVCTGRSRFTAESSWTRVMPSRPPGRMQMDW